MFSEIILNVTKLKFGQLDVLKSKVSMNEHCTTSSVLSNTKPNSMLELHTKDTDLSFVNICDEVQKPECVISDEPQSRSNFSDRSVHRAINEKTVFNRINGN